MAIPAWYRTADEWRAPFEQRPRVWTSSCEQLDVVDIGDPLWHQTHGRSDYPTAVAAALRVSFGPALLQGLDPERRPLIAARIFDEHLARAITAQPAEPWFAWRLAVLVVTKPL